MEDWVQFEMSSRKDNRTIEQTEGKEIMRPSNINKANRKLSNGVRCGGGRKSNDHT